MYSKILGPDKALSHAVCVLAKPRNENGLETRILIRICMFYWPSYGIWHGTPVCFYTLRQECLAEVKGIYAGLIVVEKKCVEIDQQQSKTTNKLSDEQWQALIALHRTLLYEHHDISSHLNIRRRRQH
jgi:hypothetical protein